MKASTLWASRPLPAQSRRERRVPMVRLRTSNFKMQILHRLARKASDIRAALPFLYTVLSFKRAPFAAFLRVVAFNIVVSVRLVLMRCDARSKDAPSL